MESEKLTPTQLKRPQLGLILGCLIANLLLGGLGIGLNYVSYPVLLDLMVWGFVAAICLNFPKLKGLDVGTLLGICVFIGSSAEARKSVEMYSGFTYFALAIGLMLFALFAIGVVLLCWQLVTGMLRGKAEE